MANNELGNTTATVSLRPPRVVILFRDDVNWRQWVRLAIRTASHIWGGAGFVFVPYDPENSDVADAFIPLVTAYDPDHVISMSVQLRDWERIAPGRCTLRAWSKLSVQSFSQKPGLMTPTLTRSAILHV